MSSEREPDDDRYAAWYAEKLWLLLPAIYRAEDSPDFDRKGPLEELVERIGAQVAVVRRSIDRLWEDQSIETCDDWIIDYVGDLLATNLVASLDARGKRLDVGKTIYYRRRKGTVALLEELATDITGWSARVVEFFQRLGRTRHGLDPAIGHAARQASSAVAHTGPSTGTLALGGAPLDEHVISVRIDVAGQAGVASWSTDLDGAGWIARGTVASQLVNLPGGGTVAVTLVDGAAAPSFIAGDTFSIMVSPDPRGSLQRAQGLVGARTRTGTGGLADLRDVHGATLAGSAFDEYAHTADVRRGRGRTGWHNVPRLGVFVWRLRSFGVRQVTPVADHRFEHLACKEYTFDPTGRDLPLFAAGDHPSGDEWVSPQPHQMPGPIAQELLDAALGALYPRSLALYHPAAPEPELVRADDLAADRRVPDGKPWIDPARGRIVCPVAPARPFTVDYHHGFSSEIGAGAYQRAVRMPLPGEGTLIDDPDHLPAVGTTGAAVIVNSLTYPLIAIPAVERVELRASDRQRPLVRPAKDVTEWKLDGAGASAVLVLDGLWVCGVDVVLTGNFDRVTLSCCTLDPGTWNAETAAWSKAADGRALAATTLRVQATIRELVIERCITGPITAEAGGRIEQLTIRESIVQAADPDPELEAIAPTGGEVSLSRCTVLGRAHVHRLDASECILHDAVTVDDTQHGCVRFTAYARPGTALPRKYESVPIAPRAALFASRAFGRPEYAQLLETAGAAIAEGAEDGSEMGAFWRERCAIKERSLLIKYQEYLPLGLEPVVIHAT